MEDPMEVIDAKLYKSDKEIQEYIKKFREEGYTESEAIRKTKQSIAYEMPDTLQKIEHYTLTLKAKGVKGDELNNEVLIFGNKIIGKYFVVL